MSPQTFSIVGHGVYSFADAAKLTRVPAQRIRRWTRGYDFRRGEGVRHSSPVVHRLPDSDHDVQWLSFADLVEIRFIDAFRSSGVSWPSIRIAAQRASKLLGRDHPFSSRKFRTDGRAIMTEIAREAEAPELLDLVNDQMAFKRIVDPHLHSGLEFGPMDEVARWFPGAGKKRVVLDPTRSFGKPIVARESVPTRALLDAFLAEGDAHRVAEIFEVSRASVSAALAFERSLAA